MDPAPPSIPGEPNAAGACAFREWHTTVWLRNEHVVWPRCCPCCLTEEDLVDQPLPVKKNTAQLAFPICRSCQKHSKLDSIAIGTSLAAALVIPPVVHFTLLSGIVLRRGLGLVLLLYLVAAVAVGSGVYGLLTRFLSGRTVDCVDTSWPVEERPSLTASDLLGSKTERIDEKQERLFAEEMNRRLPPGYLALQFRNPDYVAQFLSANGGADLPVHAIAEEM